MKSKAGYKVCDVAVFFIIFWNWHKHIYSHVQQSIVRCCQCVASPVIAALNPNALEPVCGRYIAVVSFAVCTLIRLRLSNM